MKIFGEVLEGISYKERRAAYGIAINDSEQVAVIQMPHGDFLPGGGIEENESEEECLKRELIEETGYNIDIKKLICKGVQYGYGPKSQKCMKMVGYFYLIEFKNNTGLKSELDHELVWKDKDELKKSMRIKYQKWAVEEAFKMR